MEELFLAPATTEKDGRLVVRYKPIIALYFQNAI